MSAWIVSRAHIDVLVQGLAESEIVTKVGPDELGRALWRECLVSVADRYPDDSDGERPGPVDFRDGDVDTYVYRRPSVKIDLSGLLYAIGCYQYQSCEHDGWQNSDACHWTSELRDRLSSHPDVDLHPEFGRYPWGYEEEDVHVTAERSTQV